VRCRACYVNGKPGQRLPLTSMPEYEYQRMTLPRHVSRNAAWRMLTDAAEYGKWELDVTALSLLH
jgi:hypothetical protein